MLLRTVQSDALQLVQLVRVLADAQAAVSAPAVELDALQLARVLASAQAGAAASAVDVDVGDAAHRRSAWEYLAL